MGAEKWIAYLRVSTAKQGREGLGIAAQRESVHALVRSQGGRVLAEFVEVESGRKDDRPELQRALRRAKVTGARLCIARLDRLSRSAAFLLQLRDSGVAFTAADMPSADETVVGIMAVIAQREREVLRQRTKEALVVARRRLAKQGRKLGNPNGAAALRRAAKGNAAALAKLTELADAIAENYRDTLADVDPAGTLSLRAVADELNRREIEAPRGGKWYPIGVSRLRARLAA